MEFGHTPLLIVHSRTFDPNPKLITCDVGDVGVTNNPGPEITFQNPVPTTGVFPASVALLAHKV